MRTAIDSAHFSADTIRVIRLMARPHRERAATDAKALTIADRTANPVDLRVLAPQAHNPSPTVIV